MPGRTRREIRKSARLRRAESTYPARERTKRAWLVTARHFGSLGLIGLIVILVLPRLTIGAPLTLMLVMSRVLHVIKAPKRRRRWIRAMIGRAR